MAAPPQVVRGTELVALDQLKGYPGNARKGDLDLIRESLRKHGQYKPIVAQVSTGYVLAGNHTMQAAVLEGWDEILVTWVDVDDDAARRINLVDNKANDGASYDNAALAAILEDLKGDFSGTGFEAPDLSKLLDSMRPADEEDDEFIPPVPEKPITEIGEVIRLGPHRLICGDCLKPETYHQLLDGEIVALIVTSPPYNQKLSEFKKSGMATHDKSWATWVERMASAYGDNLPENVYQDQQRQLLAVLAAHAAGKGTSFFYNHKVRYRDKAVLHPFEWLPFKADDESPWRMRSEIIWNRQSTSLTFNARMFYPRDERIFWMTLGDTFYFTNTGEVKAWGSVWDISPRIEVAVSAPFPLEVPTRPILACSNRGDVVLDPYAGSGTTLIACERQGRVGRMIEFNPAYCDVIVERWEKATGQKAVRT